jgi:hypothetical protein
MHLKNKHYTYQLYQRRELLKEHSLELYRDSSMRFPLSTYMFTSRIYVHTYLSQRKTRSRKCWGSMLSKLSFSYETWSATGFLNYLAVSKMENLAIYFKNSVFAMESDALIWFVIIGTTIVQSVHWIIIKSTRFKDAKKIRRTSVLYTFFFDSVPFYSRERWNMFCTLTFFTNWQD